MGNRYSYFISCLPLTEACPSKELFANARQFHQTLCTDAEVNIIVCWVLSGNEQRYSIDALTMRWPTCPRDEGPFKNQRRRSVD